MVAWFCFTISIGKIFEVRLSVIDFIVIVLKIENKVNKKIIDEKQVIYLSYLFCFQWIINNDFLFLNANMF
jgi:hypothetical protein